MLRYLLDLKIAFITAQTWSFPLRISPVNVTKSTGNYTMFLFFKISNNLLIPKTLINKGKTAITTLLIVMIIGHQFSYVSLVLFHTQINRNYKKMHYANDIDFFSIHANVCVQKSFKRTCPGFDTVTPLDDKLKNW